MKRLLMTGAGGGLGVAMRGRLGGLAETLVLSDIAPIGEITGNEEFVQADLTDADAILSLVEGCDGIVHFGGQSVEAAWPAVRGPNIDGMVNLYEAARKSSVRPRIVFASSNHAIGYYTQDTVIDANALPRPDSLYGVSKVFGEALASLYHDKFGIETANVRIGSSLEEPKDHRMLSTYLSFDDFARMIACIFEVPRLGCPVIYGVSNNKAVWWDNSATAYVGWTPQDSSEEFRAKLDAALGPPDPGDPRSIYHGGAFTAFPIYED